MSTPSMGNDSRSPDDSTERRSLDHLYVQATDAEDPRFNTRNGVFYPTGFIPGESPFSVNEVIRNHASDAEMSGKDKS